MIGLMKTKRVITGLCLLAGLEALGALVYLLLLPADPKNAIFWGYSATRLMMAAGLLIITICCAAAARITRFRSGRLEQGLGWLTKRKTRLWGVGSTLFFITVAALMIFCVPANRFDGLAAHYERLLPVIIWVGLVCGQTLLALLIWQDVLHFGRIWAVVKSEKGVWWFVAGGLSLFALVQVASSGLDFLTAHDTMQYNPPGAPVLPLQVMTGWLAGTIALALAGIFQRRKLQATNSRLWRSADWGIFVFIWVVAAIIWIQTPMQPTFFAPMQRPPDGVLFPYSDAALYDRTAQFALLGLGLRNGAYVDKPLYSAFLTVLHLIGGQNYELVTAMQSAVLALLPALVFALGRQLHSRPAGVVAALLVVFHGVNAIAGIVL